MFICIFSCPGTIVQKSFDTSFPSTYLQGQLRAKLSQEREERYQDCGSCGCTLLTYPYVKGVNTIAVHDALFVLWYFMMFFDRSVLRILLFNHRDQMSGRVQQTGLTGQPAIETIPAGKPSVRPEIWVNVSAFLTWHYHNERRTVLVSSSNLEYCACCKTFVGLWWSMVFWCHLCGSYCSSSPSTTSDGTDLCILFTVLARELQTDKEDLQARIVRCGEFSFQKISTNGSIPSLAGSPHNWSQDCRLGELAGSQPWVSTDGRGCWEAWWLQC